MSSVLEVFNLRSLRDVLRSLAVVCAAVVGGDIHAIDWAQFRGGAALGVSESTQLPKLAAGKGEVVWRRELPGAGWAQPVVVGGKIFITSAINPEGGKPKGMTAGVMDLSTMGRGSAPKTELEWKLFCLDEATGEVLWESSLAKTKPPYAKHASNTYATETPAASATAVYNYLGSIGVLVATDHSGKELWRKDYGAQVIGNQFGTGSSPLLVGDSLIIQQYNDEYARLICLNAADGSERWKADRNKGSAWSTPIAWRNGDKMEVIGAGQGSVIGYDLETGEERWKLGGLDTSFSCSVVADAEGLYFGTSSPGSRAPIFSIRAGCKGDLTLSKGQTSSDSVAWSKTKSGAGMPSPVVVGNLLYFLGNTAVCYDKRTGEEYFRKRVPGGTLVAGCPVVVGEQIYFVNENGKLISAKVGKEFEILSELQVGSADEVYWSTPAVTGNSLLIRSSDAVYCVR